MNKEEIQAVMDYINEEMAKAYNKYFRTDDEPETEPVLMPKLEFTEDGQRVNRVVTYDELRKD